LRLEDYYKAKDVAEIALAAILIIDWPLMRRRLPVRLWATANSKWFPIGEYLEFQRKMSKGK
jgi:hypothetical protein